ncbi:hypothetical protein DFJ74DRAFT_713681 [Hyaloraphidium curvatum]|nr:hypothetical protein DFJ74DRAFT_713681 [Hyaloraphidium curvatum]
MLLEQRLAAHLAALGEKHSSVPGDAACLSRFRSHSTYALGGTMAGTVLLGWRMIDPALLTARPPRTAAFGAQFLLVSAIAAGMALFGTRFTAIQCTACLMAVDSPLGEEARRLVGQAGVNKQAFWELARQLAGEEKRDFVDRERERAGVVRPGEQKAEGPKQS